MADQASLLAKSAPPPTAAARRPFANAGGEGGEGREEALGPGRGARDEGRGHEGSFGPMGRSEMETDQPTAGGAVSLAVEMGGKDEDDKVSQ